MSIIVAVAVGFCNALPFLLSGKLAKRLRHRGKDLTLGILMAMVVASLAVLSLAIWLCHIIVPDELVVFSVSEISAFLGCIMAYAIWRFAR